MAVVEVRGCGFGVGAAPRESSDIERSVHANASNRVDQTIDCRRPSLNTIHDPAIVFAAERRFAFAFEFASAAVGVVPAFAASTAAAGVVVVAPKQLPFVSAREEQTNGVSVRA